MGNMSVLVMFMFLLSISIRVSSSTEAPSSPPDSKASAAALLSLLSSSEEASSVNAQVAEEFKSCLKFLVPFSPTSSSSRRTISEIESGANEELENELVWWPPAAVSELARIAADSGGEPAVVRAALNPTDIPVPDVEDSKLDRCELTKTPYGKRFRREELNSYMEFLFKLIKTRGPSVGLNVSLSRFDLCHGHLFLAKDSGRLAILFHARDYPAFDKETFPYNMGYCQIGSNVPYDESSMNLRNILWLAPLPSNSTKEWISPGVLVALDARPGGIVYKNLVPEYVDVTRTIYEDDFGVAAVDVNYLNVGDGVADYKIFIF